MAFASAAKNKPSLRCTTATRQQGPSTTVGRVSRGGLGCGSSVHEGIPGVMAMAHTYPAPLGVAEQHVRAVECG
jgi:hypothetical protein